MYLATFTSPIYQILIDLHILTWLQRSLIHSFYRPNPSYYPVISLIPPFNHWIHLIIILFIFIPYV